MNAMSFFKSILPSFKRDRLVEDANGVAQQLKVSVIPMYKQILDEKIKFESDFAKNLEAIVYTELKIKKPLLPVIFERLVNVSECADEVSERANTGFERDIFISGISVAKANIIRCVEVMGFINSFAPKLLNILMIYERAQYEDDPKTYIEDNVVPKDRLSVDTHFRYFIRMIEVFNLDRKKLGSVLDKIPDVVMGKDPVALAATLGEHVVDPLKINNAFLFRDPTGGYVTRNPIYHIAMMVANYQHDRFQVNVETKKLLQLRLMDLKTNASGKGNAAIEKQIDMLQSRIADLQFKIEKYESENE